MIRAATIRARERCVAAALLLPRFAAFALPDYPPFFGLVEYEDRPGPAELDAGVEVLLRLLREKVIGDRTEEIPRVLVAPTVTPCAWCVRNRTYAH